MHAFVRTESVNAGLMLETDTEPTAVLWATYTLIDDNDKVDNMADIDTGSNTISAPLNDGDTAADLQTKFAVALQSRHNDVTAVTFIP